MSEKRSPALGVSKHINLTDKEIAGVIDHADASVSDAKVKSGVGLSEGQLCKLPVADFGDILIKRTGVYWTNYSLMAALAEFRGYWWFNSNWRPSGFLHSATIGTGSISWSDLYARLLTGATGASLAVIEKQVGSGVPCTWDKTHYLLARVRVENWTNQYIHIVAGEASPAASGNASHHFGFKIINGAIYGTVGSGANESTVSIGTVTAATNYEFYAIKMAATVYFYIDWVYKGMLTANLPTGTVNAQRIFKATIYNTVAEAKGLQVSEVRRLQCET